ncbi:NAD(P)-binding domain protein [Niveomyces insectorum RCEF 264]|uniref:NAD(P)-binding domain protein n=1 Tax=Niveomyces insectorum RCEF 264 TaxID=1081102 RepID=A0A162JCH0_9HYPO|nr:NAD(P)-binding domain protein [Niveomyces insectorum RCEF 264]
MSKLLTVFGATGVQGGSVIKAILADTALSKQFKIRGVTRDTSKPAAQQLAASGVEVVSGDLSNAASAAKAVAGAHTVFLVTNYWESMSRDTEVAQGKVVADASKQQGVQHLIFSSLRDVAQISSGRLPHVYHFDGKADIEQYIRDSGVPATFVLPGFYMSNFFGFLRKQEGSDTYTFAVPTAPDQTQLPLLDTAEDLGKFVKASIKNRDKMLGHRVLAATDYYTATQVASEFAEVTGHKAQAVQIPEDTFKSFNPPAAAQEMLENMLLLQDPGYFAGESLAPSKALVDEPPTTWKDFVAKNKGKWA